MPESDKPSVDYFLSTRTVCEMVGLSTSSIYRRMEANDFPRPRKLSGNVVRWRQSEIVAWMDAQPINKAPST